MTRRRRTEEIPIDTTLPTHSATIPPELLPAWNWIGKHCFEDGQTFTITRPELTEHKQNLVALVQLIGPRAGVAAIEAGRSEKGEATLTVRADIYSLFHASRKYVQ